MLMRYFVLPILLILLLAVRITPVNAQETSMTPEAFTQKFIRTLEEKIPGVKTEIKRPMEVHIVEPEELALINFLDNAYIHYQNAPNDVEILLDEYIDSIIATNKQRIVHVELDDLVPIVKDRAYANMASKMMTSRIDKEGAPMSALFYERINSELVMLYAFDSPTSLRFANVDDIASFSLDSKTLKQVAIENLMRRLPDIQIQGNEDIVYLVANGMFESSLLLVDGLWNKDNFPFEGNLVVFVPTRDVVLVTGSKNKSGLEQAYKIISDNQFAHIVSGYAFELVDSQWRLFSH
jgi:uncharacterized protein YtpQ (UPF0354 family)